jgi:cell division initiation protein
MPLTPLDVQKVRFGKRLRGLDPIEVENFLSLVAEELTEHVGELEKLERENRYYRQRLQDSQQRETQLQSTLLRAQKVSDELTANARKEADLTVKEAQATAERIVARAMEEAAHIESNLHQLRNMRRELTLTLRNSLQFFERMIAAEMDDQEGTATIRTLSPRRNEEAHDSETRKSPM